MNQFVGKSDMAQEKIDLITKAILASSYFGSLGQYYINPPKWGGSYNCPGPNPSAAGSPQPKYETLISQGQAFDDLIYCVTNAMLKTPGGLSGSVIVNVFLPPFVDASTLCIPNPDGSHKTAKHVQIVSQYGSQGPAPVVVTVNPADPDMQCELLRTDRGSFTRDGRGRDGSRMDQFLGKAVSPRA